MQDEYDPPGMPETDDDLAMRLQKLGLKETPRPAGGYAYDNAMRERGLGDYARAAGEYLNPMEMIRAVGHYLPGLGSDAPGMPMPPLPDSPQRLSAPPPAIGGGGGWLERLSRLMGPMR